MLPKEKSSFLGSIFASSGAGTAVLAKLACPACYPAAAALFSSLGLGYVLNEAYLNIFSAFLIVASLFGLAYRAKSRRGYAPFILGLSAAAAGVIGKLTGLDWLFFSGVGGLISASVWNIVPQRSCSACATGTDNEKPSAEEFSMKAKRKVEVFSAGCPACDEAIKLVKDNACPSCEVVILDVNESAIKSRMKSLGIKSIPAVVIDGKLADCCSGKGPSIDTLKAAGLGRA